MAKPQTGGSWTRYTVWLSVCFKKIVICYQYLLLGYFTFKNTRSLASHQKMNLRTLWTRSPTRSCSARAEQGLPPPGMAGASRVSEFPLPFLPTPGTHKGCELLPFFTPPPQPTSLRLTGPDPLHYVGDHGQRRKTCLGSSVVSPAKRTQRPALLAQHSGFRPGPS